jgi:hypothetical protein
MEFSLVFLVRRYRPCSCSAGHRSPPACRHTVITCIHSRVWHLLHSQWFLIPSPVIGIFIILLLTSGLVLSVHTYFYLLIFLLRRDLITTFISNSLLLSLFSLNFPVPYLLCSVSSHFFFQTPCFFCCTNWIYTATATVSTTATTVKSTTATAPTATGATAIVTTTTTATTATAATTNTTATTASAATTNTNTTTATTTTATTNTTTNTTTATTTTATTNTNTNTTTATTATANDTFPLHLFSLLSPFFHPFFFLCPSSYSSSPLLYVFMVWSSWCRGGAVNWSGSVSVRISPSAGHRLSCQYLRTSVPVQTGSFKLKWECVGSYLAQYSTSCMPILPVSPVICSSPFRQL